MPEALVTLNERTIMCPIELFKSTFIFSTLRFGLLDCDGSEKRYTCCISPDALPRLTQPKTPILFSLLGQIAVKDCFMTARGCLRPPDEEPVASCWLEQRSNPVSDLTWRGILPTIKALVQEFAAGSEVDTSQLLAVGADGKLRFQVIWQGDVGESGGDLPMFDEFGTEQVPASISQVPFGQPVHAVFSIDFVHDRQAGKRTVLASLFALMKA
ncbi:hypothetical protein GSI_03125 [Ganoderma sinense ZZ0214-1]|uniref:Uncharacterized protein n=1 Tax=Ganoderma sinense ZZ0214-1 TaxID=1077348 RepID=A0A2G8SKR7_9APHY|nr:hypothetical protein GSI_03125 [Ganoderma sinense ZZ0214-1]